MLKYSEKFAYWPESPRTLEVVFEGQLLLFRERVFQPCSQHSGRVQPKSYPDFLLDGFKRHSGVWMVGIFVFDK